MSSSAADASPSISRQRRSLIWCSFRPVSVMTLTQYEIDGSQSRRRQFEINLFRRLTIMILRAERDSFCNSLTFRGSKSAEGPAQQRQHVDELHIVKLVDPFIQT